MLSKNQIGKIFQYIQKAQNFMCQKNYESALKHYLDALKHYNQNKQISRPDIYRKIAQCYCNINQRNLGLAKNYLQNGIQYSKQKLKIQKKSQYKYELHDCLTNLGLIYLDEVDQIQQQTQIQKLFKLLEKSRKYLNQAFAITKREILNNYPSLSNQWYKNYCSDLLNIVNTYISEGNAFLLQRNINFDEQIYTKIIKILDKASKFYKIHKNQCNLREILSKCYYYKGVSYMFLKMYKQANHYLMKDKRYCEKHSLKQEYQKNQFQRIKLSIYKQEYDQAIKIIKQNYHKNKYLIQVLNDYKKVKQEIKEIKKNQHFNLQIYQNLIDNLFERLLFTDIIQISQQFLKKTSLKKFYFRFYFNLAKAFRKIKKFQYALQYIDDASKYCQQQSNQHLELMILKIQIFAELEPKNLERIQDLSKKSLRICEKLRSQDYKKILVQNLETFRKLSNIEKEQISDDQDIFRLFKVSQKLSDDDILLIQNNNTNSLLSKGLKKITSTKTRLKGIDYYKSKCLKHNIQHNNYIIQQIENQNLFSSLMNISQKHLCIILKTVMKLKKLDLRNHDITENILKAFIRYVQKNKIDIKQLSELIITSEFSNFKLMQQILNECKNLIHLRLSNHKLYGFPKINFEKLKLLKLKRCGITDQILKSINFSMLTHLQDLNLSSNLITQLSFGKINQINFLNQLNLSSNRLQLKKSDQTLNINIFSLKIKSINFTTKLAHNLFPCIKFAKKLNISKCSSINFLTQRIQLEYLQQDFNVRMQIQQLIMNRINLEKGMEKLLMNLILPCQRTLKEIQVKFINNSQILKLFIDSVINTCTFIKSINVRGSKMNLEEENQILMF